MGAGSVAAAVTFPGLLQAGGGTLTHGDFKISVFSDGHLTLPTNMTAPDADPAKRTAAIAKAGQTGDQFNSPLNVTFIEKGNEKILIDAGSGAHFMSSAGKLPEGLEGAGIDPESVTKVVFTHAHPDHLWGTINDFDEISFPNASYLISEPEWNFWMADDVLSKLPSDRQAFGVGAQRHLNAIKDKISTFKAGDDIIPGLSTIDTAGHTPGHISVSVATGNEELVVLGDALTHPVISFQYPNWQPANDQDKDLAVATRLKLLDRLTATKSQIIGYHLTAPGIGRVEKKGTEFAFVTEG